MCGIAGLVHWDGRRVDEDALARMTATLAHRGPEGQGVDVFEAGRMRVGLAHTRLKIIDLSEAAAQPMANEDGSVQVTFNGEIYNYRELRASLQARGVAFRTASDTEAILRLYEAEGSRAVMGLDGMFAFALWDARRRALLIARDRAGKKPLFYAAIPGGFAFASEVKALLQHPDLEAEIDVEMLPAFFLYGYVPTPSTLYQGIRKLPPGHILEVDESGKLRIEPYWDLPVTAPERVTPVSEHEAAARVRELMTEAVRRRLVADVPLGAFLSGGIDSTIVVGLMSQLMPEPVRTFSIGFAADPRFDERAYARLAARRYGTKHTEFVVEPSAVDLVERLVWHHDGPFADSSAIPTYLLSRLTRQHVTVALNGDGGDELFAGYLRFYAALLAEHVPGWLRAGAHRLLDGLPEWGGHRSSITRLQKFAGSATLPFVERYTRWISVFYEDLSALMPGSQTPREVPQPLALLEPHLRRCQDATPLSRLLYLNFKTYLLDDLLVKMDRSSMAHALEARSPFLDTALMEYAAGLPDRLKLSRGRTKVILRRAFRDLVPPEILRRGKMGFGVPLRAWFTGELRDYLRDLLLGPDARLRAYVDQGYLRRLCEAYLGGQADHSHRLWTLLTFEVWLRGLPGGSGHRAGAPAGVFAGDACPN